MVNRDEGIVVDYDGYIGTIKSINMEYVLLKQNIKNNQEINIGDTVAFLGEEINLIDEVKYIATFVEKI